MDKSILEMAEKLALVLDSDDEKHDGLQDAIEEILCEIANQGNMAVWSPEIISYTFPFLMESIGKQYGRGVFQALNIMLESRLVDKETKEKLDAISDKHWQRSDVLEAEFVDA